RSRSSARRARPALRRHQRCQRRRHECRRVRSGCSREVGPVHRRHFGPFGKPSAARHTAQPANNPFYAFFLTTGGQLPHWLTSGPWAASIELWHKFADSLTRTFSLYQWNPFNINPLVDIVRASVDFQRLNRTDEIGLFVSATCVQT